MAMLVQRLQKRLQALLVQGAAEIVMQEAGGEPRIVFDLRGEVELSQRQRSCHAVFLRLRAVKHQRMQVRAGCINGSRPGSGSAADDHHVLGHYSTPRLVQSSTSLEF